MRIDRFVLSIGAATLFIGSGLLANGEEPTNLGEFLGQEAGWVSLFDGKSLAGWTGDTKGYEVVDGAITCTPKGRNLITEKQYADFLLDFEFKLAPGSNNGLAIRYPGKGDAAYAGMELQVLDDTADKYKGLKEWQFHGSIYGVVAAKRGQLKPVGEWNRQQVIAVGGHIKIVLNGEVIVDVYDIADAKPIHDAKHPGLQRESGHIGFCGHGDFVAFRNLRVMDFSETAKDLGETKNKAPQGFSELFNGESLEGWKGLVANPIKRAAMSPEVLAKAQGKADESMNAHWKVAAGELVFDGNGQNLCTNGKYGDFDFYVDWKIPSNADSGIYLRGSPQVQIWDPANPGQKQHGNEFGSGGLWNQQKSPRDPIAKADNPIGEWNTFYIRMVGERVNIWLNGTKVVDNQVMENVWDRKQPIFREEQIELQNHGQQLWFKNVYVRELPY